MVLEIFLIPLQQSTNNFIIHKEHQLKYTGAHPSNPAPLGPLCTTFAKRQRNNLPPWAPLTGGPLFCVYFYKLCECRLFMPPPTSHYSPYQRRTQTAASGRASGSGERGSGAERNGTPSGSGPCRCMACIPQRRASRCKRLVYLARRQVVYSKPRLVLQIVLLPFRRLL